MMRYAVILLSLVGCLPIPTVKLDVQVLPVSYVTAPERVQTRYERLTGYAEASTADQYNKALYQRYFLLQQQTDTVLILVPGIFGGATSLDILARQLVAAIPGLEVWAVDRRANLLEDRSALQQSILLRDPMIAFDYYVTNAGTVDGFVPIPPDDLPFMRNWTLEVHLRDLHEIVLQARREADRLILGGHSLGASIIGYYSAFDFGGPDWPDPGANYLEGLLLIDGALGRTGGFDREPVGIGLGPLELLPGSEGLSQGRGSPYLSFGAGPAFFARRETVALLAHFKPDDLAPAGLYDFPLTNMAALGIREDDHYSPSVVFSSSMGRAQDASFAGNLTAVLLDGLDGVYSQSVTGVSATAEFVRWERSDPQREATDPHVLAKAWAGLDTNRSEWYFPLRLALDIGQYELRLEDAEGFVPTAQVRTPTLAIGAQRGLIPSPEGFAAYNNARIGSQFTSYILPRFTHLDIVQAEDNPLVPIFKLWLELLSSRP